MSDLQYDASLFPPPENALNPGWDHVCPPPGHSPPVQLQRNSSYLSVRLSSPDPHQASGAGRYPRQGPTEGGSTEFSQQAGYLQGEDISQTNPDTSADWQATLVQIFAIILLIQPPINQLVPYPAPHDQQAMDAFTPGSSNPDVFLRGLLECFLHSKWIHNQRREPQMTDPYSKHVLDQVAELNGPLPIGFNNPKKSLLTVFVGRSGSRPSCLICDKPRDTIPRVLGCIRGHLQLKPFRCEGCPACDQKNGYATFCSAALLKDHVEGQNTGRCTEWQRQDDEAGKPKPPSGHQAQALHSWPPLDSRSTRQRPSMTPQTRRMSRS